MGVSFAGDSRNVQHAEQISGNVSGDESDGVVCRRFHFLYANSRHSLYTVRVQRTRR